MMVSTNSAPEPEPTKSHTLAEPGQLISNRFLFVDVAALRAKQLKRGALPRLRGVAPEPQVEPEAGDQVSEGEANAFASPGLSDEGESPAQAPVRPPVRSRPERKLERIAMDEVREGLVGYDLPDSGDTVKPRA